MKTVDDIMDELTYADDIGKEVLIEVGGVQYPIHEVLEDSQAVVLIFDSMQEDKEMR